MDEKTVVDTIVKEYGWELSSDKIPPGGLEILLQHFIITFTTL